MKRKLIVIIFTYLGVFGIATSICAIIYECNDSIVKETIYVPVHDTVSNNSDIERIVYLEHELNLTRDSLNLVRDSIGEDLFVAKYKLARIKYYTDIVDKKPTQIKFYKGWIKRVLNGD